MGVHVPHVLPTVGIDDVSFIDGKALIRINGNQDNSLVPQEEKICFICSINLSYLTWIQINEQRTLNVAVLCALDYLSQIHTQK